MMKELFPYSGSFQILKIYRFFSQWDQYALNRQCKNTQLFKINKVILFTVFLSWTNIYFPSIVPLAYIHDNTGGYTNGPLKAVNQRTADTESEVLEVHCIIWCVLVLLGEKCYSESCHINLYCFAWIVYLGWY